MEALMLIDLDPDAFDLVMAAYLRESIDRIKKDKGELFSKNEKEELIHAMKQTHDWFSKPSEWYYKND
jgi:hypothetical protein